MTESLSGRQSGRSSSQSNYGFTTTHFCIPCRVVVFIEGQVGVAIAGLIGENRRRPIHLARQAFRVGIDQQFVRIESQAVVRLKGAMHAIAVQLTGLQSVDVAVPTRRWCARASRIRAVSAALG